MDIEKIALINTLVNCHAYEREELEEYSLPELKEIFKEIKDEEDCIDELIPNESFSDFCEHENFGY